MAEPFTLTGALLRPERILLELGRDAERAPLPIAAGLGAMLLPALFELSRGNKFFYTWSNPITWVAVGVLLGLAWVQGVAFPAALFSRALGGRGGFAETRTAVAYSLLPCLLLLSAYWLIRLASFGELAGDFLALGWPLAALWSLENLRRCLLVLHRVKPSRARVAAVASGTVGIWGSLLIGLVPFFVVGFAILVQSRVYRRLVE